LENNPAHICFVVLNYRQPELVIKNVENIQKIFPEAFFVIVDNDSQDGSVEKMQKSFKGMGNLRLFDTKENGGYARGNNFGVKKAVECFNPEFIAIMNPDVILPCRESITRLLEAFSKDPLLALCTGLMLDENRRLVFSVVASKVPDKLDDAVLNLPFLASRLNPVRYHSFRVEENGLIYVEVVPGSFFLARTSLFLQMGLFDESTFLFGEERILGKKARETGFRIALVPTVFFIHDHSKKSRSFRSKLRSYRELIKSRFLFNRKYNSWPQIVVIPCFLVSAGIGFVLTVLSWFTKTLFIPKRGR